MSNRTERKLYTFLGLACLSAFGFHILQWAYLEFGDYVALGILVVSSGISFYKAESWRDPGNIPEHRSNDFYDWD